MRVLESLLEDLRKMEDEFDLHPDIICFTGDLGYGNLTESPLESQLADGAEFLEQVRLVFTPSVPLQNVFIVPGNHDIDRKNISSADTDWLNQIIQTMRDPEEAVNSMLRDQGVVCRRFMTRLDIYREFLKKFGFDHLAPDFVPLCYGVLRNVNGFNLGIAGLNSAWSSAGGQEKGQLWLGRWQVETAFHAVRDATITIALSHHPVNWLTSFEDPRVAREISHLFQFHLHGHEHQDWVEDLAGAQGTRHVRIAAGACYESSKGANGYNFCRLHPTSDRCEVFLRRYDRGGHGWVAGQVHGKTDNAGRQTLDPLGYQSNERLALQLTIIDANYKREQHLVNHQYMQAADLEFEVAEVLGSRDIGQSRAFRRSALDHLALASHSQAPLSFTRTVTEYYRIDRRDDPDNIANPEKQFTKTLRFLFRSVAYLESQSAQPMEAIYNSSALGRSPLRPVIASSLNELERRIHNSPDGSLHEGCLICTATFVVEAILFCRPDLSPNAAFWLRNQRQNKWQTKDGVFSPHYAALAVDALLLLRDPDSAENLVFEAMASKRMWRRGCERHYLESVGQLLHAIGRFYTAFPNAQASNVFRQYQKEVEIFFRQASRHKGDQQGLALRGLLTSHLLEDRSIASQMSALARELCHRLCQDRVWNIETGGWGSDIIETMFRVYSILSYWEYFFEHGGELPSLVA